MTKALILRDRSIAVSDAEREVANRVFLAGLRGVDVRNHARWKQFLKRMFSMEDGEIAEVATRIPRSGPFHRFHMAIGQAVFDAQDRFTQFEQFRNWLKIGAGHVEWVPGPKSGIVPLPKSISYAELEEPEMREVHEAMMAFLRAPHASFYLWKHLGAERAAEMMEAILRGFNQ
jgi:hypothetical protein